MCGAWRTFIDTRIKLTSPPSSHRISFLHYHKTGHDLSRVLARGVSTTLAMHLTEAHHQPKRERFDSELSCSGPNEVQVWTAPDLFQRVAPVCLPTTLLCTWFVIQRRGPSRRTTITVSTRRRRLG